MPLPWESNAGDEPWSDREAWRGDVHVENVDGWREDVGEVWAGEDEEEEEAEPGSGWPEDMAGPEYWMFKRDCDD